MSLDEAILSVRNLTKSFVGRSEAGEKLRREKPRLVAVDDVSFELRPHQAIGVVGESGSGKSTIAKCLVRLHEPDSGAIAYRTRDVLAAGPKELARIRRSMQLIYQDP